MNTQHTRSFRRLGILSLVVLGASTLGGCVGTYVYSDHGWSNSWIWSGGHGHRSNHSSIIIGGRHYSGGHNSGGDHRGGGSRRGSSRSHSSGRSGRH